MKTKSIIMECCAFYLVRGLLWASANAVWLMFLVFARPKLGLSRLVYLKAYCLYKPIFYYFGVPRPLNLFLDTYQNPCSFCPSPSCFHWSLRSVFHLGVLVPSSILTQYTKHHPSSLFTKAQIIDVFLHLTYFTETK